MQIRRMNEEALVFELCDKYDDCGQSLVVPLDVFDVDDMDGKKPKEIWIYKKLKSTIKIYKMKWKKFLKQIAIGDVGLIPKSEFEKVYRTITKRGI